MSKKTYDPNQMTDEWGDPVGASSAGPQYSAVDEWGDPVKKVPVPNDPKHPVVDEWGDPVRYVRVNDDPEKQLSEKEKIALEKELVKQGVIFPRSHYLPRGRFRGVLAVCLAFLFGLFICLGALVGGVAWAGTQAKLSQLLGANTEKWISPEYADMSVLDFVSTVIKDMSGGINNLNDIAKYTPAVDSIIDLIGENTASLGIELTDDLRTQLKETPFSGLGAFFMDDVLKTVELGKVMQVTPNSDAMMVGLCYGEEDLDYTVGPDNSFVQTENGRAPTTIGMLMDSPTDLLSTMRLGTLMGLSRNVTETSLKDNAMMYALCYGKRGVDYNVENGKIKVVSDQTASKAALADKQEAEGSGSETYVHTFPTTLDALMNHSNAVINSLELGTMLGIDTDVTEDKINSNGVMYSLAYGSRGTDWQLQNGQIVMLDGHGADYPTKMGSFTENSSTLIEGMEVETLMSIELSSDKLMHYLAYGPEMTKGEAPYTQDPATNQYHDAEGQLVTQYGYLLETKEDGTVGYPTETVKVKNEQGQEVDELQYVGGGRFVYEYEIKNGEQTITGITMLPDPNDPAGKPYSKKKISDLTDKDANLVEGMKIGDTMDIDSNSSAIMRAMKDWTIGDLSDQNKIESLKLSDVLGEESDSRIMQALAGKTLAQMKQQDTIDSLKLSDVLEINDGTEDDGQGGTKQPSSGILQAMRNWTLDDLGDQARIDRLKIGNVVEIGEESSGIMQAMKDWSISELTDQDKINSLTLGDVMTIDASKGGILVSLSDCPIGSLQDRVDTLTLTQILGEEDIMENKILKHLADSTVDTLANDMETLPIGKVFADEMFSFMEIKDNKGYQKFYKDYFKNHADGIYNLQPKNPQTSPTTPDDLSETPYKASENPYLPHPFTITVKELQPSEERKDVTRAIKASDVTTYYVLTNSKTEVEAKYYLNKEGTGSPVDQTVKTDAAIVKANRENNPKKPWQTPYYFEEEIVLTPVYIYREVKYDNSDPSTWTKVTVNEADGKLTCTVDGQTYELKQDKYSLYYEHEVTVSEEGEEPKTEMQRVDLERVIDHYVDEHNTSFTFDADGKLAANGKTYELRHKKAVKDAEGTVTADAYDYVIERTHVYEVYTDKDGKVYPDQKINPIEERYRYVEEGKAPVELDRYLEGVWYLLLAKAEGEVAPSEDAEDGEAGVITYDASKPILEVDGLITGINTTMTDTRLWELYFHGMLDENPFYSFKELTWLDGGKVTFEGPNSKTNTAYNLNDVKISEVVALVKGLIKQVDTALGKRGNLPGASGSGAEKG